METGSHMKSTQSFTYSFWLKNKKTKRESFYDWESQIFLSFWSHTSAERATTSITPECFASRAVENLSAVHAALKVEFKSRKSNRNLDALCLTLTGGCAQGEMYHLTGLLSPVSVITSKQIQKSAEKCQQSPMSEDILSKSWRQYEGSGNYWHCRTRLERSEVDMLINQCRGY